MSFLRQQLAELEVRVAALEAASRQAPPSAPAPAPELTLRMKLLRILDAVAAAYGIAREEILGPGRRAELVRARHVAWFVSYATTCAGLQTLGELYERDHTGVSYGIRQITTRMKTEPALEAEVRVLVQRFLPPSNP